MSELSPAAAASLVTPWLRLETAYTNHKYPDANPQASALKGGLQPGGEAYGHFSSRFDAIRLHALLPDQEIMVLKTSQALGKFVATGRVLLRAITEHHTGRSRIAADAYTFGVIEKITQEIPKDPRPFEFPNDSAELRAVWEEGSLPDSLQRTADALAVNDVHEATLGTHCVIAETARLFVAHASQTGVIAQPGINSTFQEGELTAWDWSKI